MCSSEHTRSSASAASTAIAALVDAIGGSGSAWFTTACSISALPKCTSCLSSTAGAALYSSLPPVSSPRAAELAGSTSISPSEPSSSESDSMGGGGGSMERGVAANSVCTSDANSSAVDGGAPWIPVAAASTKLPNNQPADGYSSGSVGTMPDGVVQLTGAAMGGGSSADRLPAAFGCSAPHSVSCRLSTDAAHNLRKGGVEPGSGYTLRDQSSHESRPHTTPYVPGHVRAQNWCGGPHSRQRQQLRC